MTTEDQNSMDTQALADTLLHALDAGDVTALRNVIALGVDPNTCWSGDNSASVTDFMRKRQFAYEHIKYPALIVAILHGSDEAVRLLLEAGADVNGKLRYDDWALDALQCACGQMALNASSVTQEEIVRTLVQQGVSTLSNALTMVPESRGRVVEFLLNYPQMPDVLLRTLCKVGEYYDENWREESTARRIADRLIDLGVDVNATYGDATALINAISNPRRPGLASYLIDKGADPTKVNKRSPLTQALACGFSGSVQMLLHYGVNVAPVHLGQALSRLGGLNDDDIVSVLKALHRSGIDPRSLDLKERTNGKSLLIHLLKMDCEKSARFLFQELGEDLHQKTDGGAPLARVCGPKTKQMLLSLRTAESVVGAMDEGVTVSVKKPPKSLGML
jgi:ankyrin repeat protein